MCVLLFDVFKLLLLRKTDVLQTGWKKISPKENLSLVYKTVSQISFKLFCSGNKTLLSEFLWKWGWFHGHNERFQKYFC